MVNLIVALATRFRVGLLELVGSGIVVAGVAQFSGRAAVVVAGVFVLAKSMEADLKRAKGEGGSP